MGFLYSENLLILVTHLVCSFLEFAEADSFFCFTNLMSEIRDNFIKTLDDSQCGIGMIILLLQRNSGLEAIKQSQTQNKAHDWLCVDTCPQAANHCALF